MGDAVDRLIELHESKVRAIMVMIAVYSVIPVTGLFNPIWAAAFWLPVWIADRAIFLSALPWVLWPLIFLVSVGWLSGKILALRSKTRLAALAPWFVILPGALAPSWSFLWVLD